MAKKQQQDEASDAGGGDSNGGGAVPPGCAGHGLTSSLPISWMWAGAVLFPLCRGGSRQTEFPATRVAQSLLRPKPPSLMLVPEGQIGRTSFVDPKCPMS